ncbi:MAG: PHP domain-containing protein [Pirellulales bacterium]|nr:PHP domain-containing protein [Pirellulales bacterium]
MPTPHHEPEELLVDTHVHSNYSDGLAGIVRIERHCQNRGLGVAITDHNEIRGAVKLCEAGRVPTMPAIEVGTEEGLDLLVYFPRPEEIEEFFIRAIEPHLRSRFMVRSWVQADACLQAAREMGGYVSLAHPFALGRKSLDYQHGRRGRPFVDRIMESVHAIELHNGGVLRAANRKAQQYAESAGKRLTVGSDSHRLATIGSSGTYLHAGDKPTSESLFLSLAAGENLRFKAKGSATAATLPLLGIIALKHTHHFVRSKKRKR